VKKEEFMLQDMKLTAINTEKVHNQVYEQLKHLLLEGTWKPGEKIPSENKLTNIFGVSRISVRSAIKSLIAQGFLEARQGEGTFVVDVSIDQNFNLLIPMMNYSRESILEVLEFRRVFEVGMMPVVIEKITPEQIQELENNVIALEQADDADIDENITIDLAFHRMFCLIAENKLLLRVNQILSELYRHTMASVVTSMGSRYGRYYHREILEAVRVKDAEAARNIMEEHIVETIKYIQQADHVPIK